MITRADYETLLRTTEVRLRELLRLGPEEQVDTATILGTGWGDAFEFEAEHTVPMTDLDAFKELEVVEGHARQFEIGRANGRRVLVLRGRIHMNEDTFNPDVRHMARLQVELLIKLGATNLVPTCGVGSLDEELEPGSVMLISSFVSAGGGEVFPLFPGEFVEPASVLDPELIATAFNADEDNVISCDGPHVFWRGPHFEGVEHDKANLAALGGRTVGMSVKPECAIAALHKGVRVLAPAFVTNPPTKQDHAEHIAVAKRAAKPLAKLLTAIIGALPHTER